MAIAENFGKGILPTFGTENFGKGVVPASSLEVGDIIKLKIRNKGPLGEDLYFVKGLDVSKKNGAVSVNIHMIRASEGNEEITPDLSINGNTEVLVIEE